MDLYTKNMQAYCTVLYNKSDSGLMPSARDSY